MISKPAKNQGFVLLYALHDIGLYLPVFPTWAHWALNGNFNENKLIYSSSLFLREVARFIGSEGLANTFTAGISPFSAFGRFIPLFF